MSAPHDEDPTPVSKVQKVRQAADTLGVSERTVYRRLRSGKLDQLPAKPKAIASVMTVVSEEKVDLILRDQIAPQLSILACQNDMTNDKLSALRQELDIRDAQIRSLLENQQELTHTIQKLQAQIFELARLALQQPVQMEAKPENVPEVAPPPLSKRHGSLSGWLANLLKRDTDR